MSKEIPIEIGGVYNDLTVLERLGLKYKSLVRTYRCRCICGKETVVSGPHLRNGNTKSCGHRQIEATIKEVKSRTGVRFFQKEVRSASQKLFRYYSRTAIKRGFVFDLDFETFLLLTSSPCTYCGALPSKICKAGGGDVYVYNGVDRVKNDLGYTLENSRPCCAMCNHMKHAYDVKTFLEHVQRIVAFCRDLKNS